MASPFLAEIKMFGGNFAPRGYAFCEGQIMSIQQNTALFSLLGTTYGGNGTQTFALPDLRGRVPIAMGQGPGLTDYVLGEIGGVESVTLGQAQMPAHNHVASIPASSAAGTATAPASNTVPAASTTRDRMYTTNAPDTSMAWTSTPAGSGLPHSNIQPFLAVSFIIALQGIFPSRN